MEQSQLMTTIHTLPLDAPLLSAQDEIRLADQIEAGVLATELLRAEDTIHDRADLEELAEIGGRAWDQFFQSNLRLALFVAKTEARRWSKPIDDVFQASCLGLAQAIMRWDHCRGVRFSTFAFPWIKEKAAKEASKDRAGDRGIQLVCVSPMVMSEIDQGDPDPDPFKNARPWWFDRLVPRQQDVLRLRFGIGTACHTLEQTAKKLGLSISQVRRVEAKAIESSRKLLASA